MATTTNSEKGKMTEEEQAESLDFLRSHGVLVETPEDRANTANAAKELSGLQLGAPDTTSFSYVKLPADDSEAPSEVVGVVYADHRGTGDKLPLMLAPSFGSGAVDEVALKQRTAEHMAGGPSLASLTPDILAKQPGATETFRLSNNVSMYLDEIGSLKRLPINRRASMLASRCGYGDGVMFSGDMYVGKVDPFTGRNVDFKLADMDPAAEWAMTAMRENMARQQANGGAEGGISAEELATKGGEGDGYTWSQTEDEVEILIAAPAGTKGKDVKAKFGSSTLSVAVGSGGTAIAINLFSKVTPDGCTWQMSDGNVAVTLEKATEGETWPALLR